MSVGKKSAVFLLLVVALSWAPMILAWRLAPRNIPSQAFLVIAVVGLLLTGLICTLAFEKNRRIEALGMRIRFNSRRLWTWCLFAVLIAIALAVVNIGVAVLFSPHGLVSAEGMGRQLAESQHQEYSEARSLMLAIAGAVGLAFLGGFILLTPTEELAWRGYLYHLWRPFGFWRASFAIGLVWGIWHWPMIYLFGLNYPDHRLVGLAIFPISSMLLSPIMTLVRDRGGSIVPAGILHAGFNSTALLFIIAVERPLFPWDVVGIGYFTALAAGASAVALFRKGTPDPYRAGDPTIGASTATN